MTIEEKAKAYDKVREKIAVRFGTNVAEEIFSEFEESEDERIRKALISVLKSDFENDTTIHDISVGDIIAWLEKQGESYTKKDVDDAWLKGMCDAKRELEKQAEVVSDKDDIETEEKGIRKAFNKIWEEKQDKQKSQRMISAEAKEAMYDKPADTVGLKCEESKTKIFDAPTPFEDKLYAFVLACEILVDPSKREFILEHSQEILDAAREQIGKEQSSAWSEEDEKMLADACIMLDWYQGNNWWKAQHIKNWLKFLKQRIGG